MRFFSAPHFVQEKLQHKTDMFARAIIVIGHIRLRQPANAADRRGGITNERLFASRRVMGGAFQPGGPLPRLTAHTSEDMLVMMAAMPSSASESNMIMGHLRRG